jgi:hypothetical protein
MRIFAVALAWLSLASIGVAAPIVFVPPTDPAGMVFTTNSNDLYSSGRGMAFEVAGPITIDSVGIFQNLTNVTLSYTISQTTTRVGQVDAGETILRSGSTLANTAGLQFIDFGFAPLTFLPGNFYHIEFTFNGNSNQNFFHRQGTFGGNINGIDNFNQAGFLFINGTAIGNTDNFVIPSIRVNAIDAVPEPASMLAWGLLSGVGLVGYRLRRRKVTA